MKRALGACMVGLVLVNLAFVLITEASRWTWLGPLLALTIASPLLVRFTEYFVYRALWNVAVLGAFGLLVQHVTSAGVEHLLEDGLLLAALCQVHLLNNLSRLQKPDLLFFNSFLIAVVTSYLSLDLGYSLVFLVYAPLFVVSLQLLTLSRSGAPDNAALVARAVWSGLGRGVFVLGLTLVVFFFMPRDFGRKGLLGEQLNFRPPGAIGEVAFAEEIDLERSGKVISSDRVVMKIRVDQGVGATVPTHWRGATLDRFDGKEWRPASALRPLGKRWLRNGNGFVRGARATTARVEVLLTDPTAPRLFVPLAAKAVRVTTRARGVRVHPLPDANLRCVRTARNRRPLRYAVELHNGWRDRGGTIRAMTRMNRQHIHVPFDAMPRSVRNLARDLRRQLAPDAEQHRIVEHMRAYVERRYRYLLPGAVGGARDLEEFIAGDAGAHCEYFATALALMLRAERIPCRVVTGYRSVEWDEAGESLTVRARHAHAWVEVFDPEAGWYTVDPTPSQGADAASAQGLWAQLRVRATDFWTRITGFNESSRGGVLSWVAALPGRLKDWVAAHPGGTGALFLGLVALLAGLRLRRRRRVPAVIRVYRAAVRRTGVAQRAGETPRELLARLRAHDVAPERMQRLAAATEAHERARYAAQA